MKDLNEKQVVEVTGAVIDPRLSDVQTAPEPDFAPNTDIDYNPDRAPK